MPIAQQTGNGVTQGTGTPVLQMQATNQAWATQLLQDLGPTYVTQTNIENVLAWMASEEPPTNWFNNNNPLNINAGGTGSDTFSTLSDAAAASARVIMQPNMAAIKNALASSVPYDQFKAAAVSSPWASGHYGGGAAFASLGVPTVSAAGKTLGNPSAASLAGSSTAVAGTCNDGKPPLIDATIFKFGTSCELKALTGGLLIGAGVIVMVVGAVVLVTSSKPAQAVLGVAGAVVPEGRAATVLTGVGANSTASRTISSAKATPSRSERRQMDIDQGNYDRFTQSGEAEATRKRNAAYRARQRRENQFAEQPF